MTGIIWARGSRLGVRSRGGGHDRERPVRRISTGPVRAERAGWQPVREVGPEVSGNAGSRGDATRLCAGVSEPRIGGLPGSWPEASGAKWGVPLSAKSLRRSRCLV